IKIKLDSLRDLPQGAGPIYFLKDFGDTASLMLTVASPQVDQATISSQAKEIQESIAKARSSLPSYQAKDRLSLVVPLSANLNADRFKQEAEVFVKYLQDKSIGEDWQVLEGSGFIGIDGTYASPDEEFERLFWEFIATYPKRSEFHPDTW